MKTLKRKKLDIPAAVRGRPVTNRGVHLQPFGYHGFWLDREVEDSYWTDLLKSMRVSWVVILNEGDSVLEERHGTNPLKVWLDQGIIPIIRDKQFLPHGFANVETVRRTVDLYEKYGLRPFWQLYNEPFDSREWKDGDVPPYDEAWQIIAGQWSEGARNVVEAGAYVGFPDGPCYAENPFERLRPADGLEFFEKGMAFYAPHNYGLGRPLWYPYDAVTRHGAQLSEPAYQRLLDDYADYPNWHDAPVQAINKQRREWADPARTAWTDDTCWRGWEKTVAWAMESLGFVPPMAMTEGGWTPRARAGVEPVDNRWSYATPNMVAKKSLQMYDTPSPFFAICPWLLATSDMGGTGWFDDAWHGGAFSDKYGHEKPVIKILRRTSPKEIEPRTEPMVIDVDGDTRDWAWVKRAYGASYRRQATPEPAGTPPEHEEEPAPLLHLIEVHEYEGPATLDVLVVDGDGLPVEGVEFYYHHPEAPSGDEPAEHDWYGQAVTGVTDASGRISFPVTGTRRAPYAYQGALWPKGRGDALQNLGLLANTRNRHLNGVWQLVGGESLPTEEPDSGPGPGPGGGPISGGDPVGDPDHEPSPGWAMTVEHRPGARFIAGSLPRAGIDVTITDPWGNASHVTSGSKLEHGPGGFEVVAPHVATYTLAFLDQAFEVQTHDGATFVTFVEGDVPDAEPDSGDGPDSEGESQPEAPTAWVMTVEHRPGARFIAGSLPRAGIDVTITDPWGNASHVTSGSKLDHGPGGFEVVAPHVATYTLTFLDQAFEVQTHDGATFVTFVEGDAPDAEPDSGGGPDSETEGTTGRNKLGFYCEVTTIQGLGDAIRDVQPPTLLTHANDRGLLQAMRRHLSPDTFVVGRLYVDKQVQDAWLRSIDPEGIGRAFADEVLSHDFGMATERGENGRLLIDAWMTLNECVPGPASQAYQQGTAAEREAIRRAAGAYDRFQVAFRNRLKEADGELEAVAFNFGAGNFVDAAGYLDWFPRSLESYVYLGFHEYGWPALSTELDPEAKSSAGTYRTIMQGIRQHYGTHHKVIITEAGLARLFKHIEFPPGDVGWLYPGETISQQNYWRSLEWYNTMLCEDDFVLGACLFEVGHGGVKWETFRHLGLDNDGNPLHIIPWIKGLREPEPVMDLLPVARVRTVTLEGRVVSQGQPVDAVMVRLLGTVDTLGADPRAAAFNPSAISWTQTIDDYQGSLWNCWQKFVAPTVAGITWEEFKAQVPEHNPSLRETGGRFEAGQTYCLPQNDSSVQPQIVWDRQVSGFSGHRWSCWKQYVRAKVAGLSWDTFKDEVVARNPHLADDGYNFVAVKSYLLPRNAGQDLYTRVDFADSGGWYGLTGIPVGSYDLEVEAEAKGYQPFYRSLDIYTDVTLDLELEAGTSP